MARSLRRRWVHHCQASQLVGVGCRRARGQFSGTWRATLGKLALWEREVWAALRRLRARAVRVGG
eukprot:781592-Prymnesium_polylepis.1